MPYKKETSEGTNIHVNFIEPGESIQWPGGGEIHIVALLIAKQGSAHLWYQMLAALLAALYKLNQDSKANHLIECKVKHKTWSYETGHESQSQMQDHSSVMHGL